MATVPLGLGCAMVAMVLTGVSLNVYSQIGLVLLVGIIAKNGILVVEFANQLRDHGAGARGDRGGLPHPAPAGDDDDGGDDPRRRAAPLLGGAGAEARHALGWVIVGGLGLATVLTLFLTPVAYLLLAGLSKPRAEETRRLREELAEVGQRRPPAAHRSRRGACADGDCAQMACTATPSAPARSPERAPRSSLELSASIRNSSDANRQ